MGLCPSQNRYHPKRPLASPLPLSIGRHLSQIIMDQTHRPARFVLSTMTVHLVVTHNWFSRVTLSVITLDVVVVTEANGALASSIAKF
jgi:hypothetical protein